MSDKQFCTIEYLDEDGNEMVDHAVLSIDEQMKLMTEFIKYGVVATIHEHISNVISSNEENVESIEETNNQNLG